MLTSKITADIYNNLRAKASASGKSCSLDENKHFDTLYICRGNDDNVNVSCIISLNYS